MKLKLHNWKSLMSLAGGLGLAISSAFGQITFDPTIDVDLEFDLLNSEVILPASPLQSEVLFIGGVDMVQTTAIYGNDAGTAIAKQWHDFIGVTPDTNNDGQYWISVNHEMIVGNDSIGDGGGMTVFKVEANETGQMTILEQTLEDGREGEFFNVDFANTVGETGMNCGGISSGVDGRIWTAEEWFRSSNSSLGEMRDTADWTIESDIEGDFDGSTVKKYQNFNYFVEIDPREAKAVRKQYNWGRAGWEGGAIASDNQTVYLGVDGTPGWFVKFVADEAGDFTSGTLYLHKEDAEDGWVEIDNTILSNMLQMDSVAQTVAATMFNRVEWVAIDPATQKVYFTETGRDNPSSRWADELEGGAMLAEHHIARASAQGVTADSSAYWDYYGRVMEYDPSTGEVSVFLEAGPAYTASADGVAPANYPDIHLTNPDGLNFLHIDDQSYMIICEDLNGTSHNRVPYGVSNKTCEMFLLDMSVTSPSLDDLKRILVGPFGAEITGAVATPDGKTLLVNSQHPKDDQMINTYPYNNSVTIAISNWTEGLTSLLKEPDFDEDALFEVYPNPTSRELMFNETSDVGVYDIHGKLVLVERNVKRINVSHLNAGTYLVKSANGASQKVVIE